MWTVQEIYFYFKSPDILVYYYGYILSFVLNMKNIAQYSANVLYIMFLLFGGSCVSDHDCMFTCQRKGSIFKGIFILFIKDGSLCVF